MSKLRVKDASGHIDWEATAETARAQRDQARTRARAEWATMSVQEARQLAREMEQAEEPPPGRPRPPGPDRVAYSPRSHAWGVGTAPAFLGAAPEPLQPAP